MIPTSINNTGSTVLTYIALPLIYASICNFKKFLLVTVKRGVNLTHKSQS